VSHRHGVVILSVFPGIAMWLPNLVYNRLDFEFKSLAFSEEALLTDTFISLSDRATHP
jgi:hypothetical protein